MIVVIGQIIGNTRGVRMHYAATKFFSRNVFTCRCFHQRRTT